MIVEFVVYFFVALLMMYAILPLFGMPRIANVVFTMFGVTGAFAILNNLKKNLIYKNVLKRGNKLNNTLDSSLMVGISQYYLKLASHAVNPVSQGKYIYLAYLGHDIETIEVFPYLNQILEMEKAYDDFFLYRVIVVRELLAFRLLENGQLDQALKLFEKNLKYINKMNKENQIPVEIMERLNTVVDCYKDTIEFMKKPNLDLAIKMTSKEKDLLIDRIRTHYLTARVFIEHDMIEEAKIILENAIEFKGNYRLLMQLLDYYNEL
jgi:tetratricopeptide (TPR) repeat protein